MPVAVEQFTQIISPMEESRRLFFSDGVDPWNSRTSSNRTTHYQPGTQKGAERVTYVDGSPSRSPKNRKVVTKRRNPHRPKVQTHVVHQPITQITRSISNVSALVPLQKGRHVCADANNDEDAELSGVQPMDSIERKEIGARARTGRHVPTNSLQMGWCGFGWVREDGDGFLVMIFLGVQGAESSYLSS
jgi:hypothetical protein